MSIRSELREAAHKAGGSYKTREARDLIAGRLADFLRGRNIQIRGIDHLKLKHVDAYVQSRLEAGIGKRTLQNEVTAIRCILRATDRGKLASQIDNRKLGIAGTSRDGTKTAIPEERFEALRAMVQSKDEGVLAVVNLQRALGLRAEEAVKACKSLRTWEQQLTNINKLLVIYGTKGGRPRYVHPGDLGRALRAIRAAQVIAQRQGGVLINKPTEKEAMARYKYVMTSSGFVGKESGHSLRYAFAPDQMQHYEALGYSRSEALAQTSMDLGHGDGRGRYIEQVYGR